MLYCSMQWYSGTTVEGSQTSQTRPGLRSGFDVPCIIATGPPGLGFVTRVKVQKQGTELVDGRSRGSALSLGGTNETGRRRPVSLILGPGTTSSRFHMLGAAPRRLPAGG